ncbi:unnamed protein product, partial [Owenia fusiformis]
DIRRRPAEYFQVKCPCDFQQYTYCPTYKPGDEAQGCSWSTWTSTYSACSVTCGTGVKTKTRTRTKQYSTAYTGRCEGDSQDTSTLRCINPTSQSCQVPGCRWNAWSNWRYSACSVTCRIGTKTKTRFRTKQYSTAFTGRCEGNSQETSTLRCFNPLSIK